MTLMAQPFDAGRLKLAGEAVPIAEIAARGGAPGDSRRYSSVSAAGALVYRTGGRVRSRMQLTWFDRQGKVAGAVGEPGDFSRLALSPDATQVAFVRGAGEAPSSPTADIWLLEFARGTTTRLISGAFVNGAPVWSPDGSRIIFESARDGTRNLYQKVSSGASNEELLLKSSEPKTPTDWSHDGRFLLYAVTDPKSERDIWMLPMVGQAISSPAGSRGASAPQPTVYLKTEFSEHEARFSPDGRFVAYESNASGRTEIYVRPFPQAEGNKWTISKGGGIQPRWHGKELFYVGRPGRTLMAVAVTTSPVFKAGAPKALFESPAAIDFVYDVTADGGWRQVRNETANCRLAATSC